MAAKTTRTSKTTAEKEAAIIQAAKLGPEAAVAEAERQYPKGRPAPRDRAKAKASTKAPAPKGKLTGRAAVAKVMADGQPRSAKEITSAAVKLTAMAGKTPEATLGALLYTEAKKPNGMVTRTGAGRETRFALRPAATTEASA